MPKTDLEQYRPRLREFLERRGVPYNKSTKKWRCPNPGHADKDPSATLYQDVRLNCNICSDRPWDIFAVAGLLDGLHDFPDQLKSVQDTLGGGDYTPVKSTTKKKSSTRPKYKPVPLTREELASKVNRESLLKKIRSSTWLDGTIKDDMQIWSYRNADAFIEIFDVRFENTDNKKAVITFFWDGKVIRATGAPVLLYDRDQLAADTDSPVLIVEGAKTAEAAKNVPGFVVTTWNGGGKKCKQVDWKILKNRTVYIYPDDDQKIYGEAHERAGELMPWHEQPGMITAFDIKKKLPNAIIVKPVQAARDIKADGADIVEVLEVMTGQELADYILSVPGLEAPPTAPKSTPPAKSPPAPTPPASPLDTPSDAPDGDIFPFRVLGVADDGKGYFLDRHERLAAMALGSITSNKLLTLASLTYWQREYAAGKDMSRNDWTAATDAVMEVCGRLDFDHERVRGRGAWREPDGRLCYHDGFKTIGEPCDKRTYLRMSRRDIGLDSPHPDLSDLTAILDIVGKLNFETRADMIRCLAWSTLAPFAGALPWRPAGLLTGRSEAGKSEVVRYIINPLAMPIIASGGESTEAGVRQAVGINSMAIVIDEADTDTPKKRQRRDDVLSLMRQSTSDETPKALKGTIDGKGMRFTLRSMFLFAAISPEVESIADDNRLFRVNMETKGHTPEQWQSLKAELIRCITPEICAGVRALTWARLKDIFSLADRIAPVIQRVTHKSSRFSMSESLLFAAYQIVWKQHELSDENLHEFFTQIYDWQPPEESRDDVDELLDLLLDHIIREGRDTFTLRSVLQHYKEDYSADRWKEIAGRYGLGLTPDGDLAMAKNFNAISKIIERGKGYQRIFWRHPLLIDKNKTVHVAGKLRSCLVIRGDILSAEGDVF